MKPNAEMFYYCNLSPILVGDKVRISVSNFVGVIGIIKGAWCIILDDKDIDPILFYNIYIHPGNIIKAFERINQDN